MWSSPILLSLLPPPLEGHFARGRAGSSGSNFESGARNNGCDYFTRANDACKGCCRRGARISGAELIAYLVEACPEALEHGGDVWGWFVEFVIEPKGSRAGQYRPFRVWRR